MSRTMKHSNINDVIHVMTDLTLRFIVPRHYYYFFSRQSVIT